MTYRQPKYTGTGMHVTEYPSRYYQGELIGLFILLDIIVLSLGIKNGFHCNSINFS